MKKYPLFQLHHTGIKTIEFGNWAEKNPNFNCTIQELKLTVASILSVSNKHFNCTIQELKHYFRLYRAARRQFQLHHTGIKTPGKKGEYKMRSYFNCTIQELKRKEKAFFFCFFANFNCTIQELKQNSFFFFLLTDYVFQLHHTGIKMSVETTRTSGSGKFQLHHTGIKMYPLYYSQKLTTSFGVIWLVF